MTLHTFLSLVKSGVRALGYYLLGQASTSGVLDYGVITANHYGWFWRLDPSFPKILLSAAVVLIVSELIGIAEELWPGAYKGTETKS